MLIKRLHIVLASITLYWYLLSAMNVASGGVEKAALTLLLWVAAFVLVENYITNYRTVRSAFNRTAFALISILLLINVINIFRGFIDAGAILTTALGNPYNALSLITPLAVGFAGHKISLYVVNRYLLFLMVVGFILSIIAFLINAASVTYFGVSSAWSLIYPMIFLVGAIAYLGRNERYAIIGVSILYLGYLGFIVGSRTAILRISLLYLFNWVVVMPRRYISHFIYPFLIFALVAFAYQVISTSYSKNESIFEQSLSYLQNFAGMNPGVDIAAKADSRTFIYIEVISDLVNTGHLMFGKGGSGTYFSSYFQETGEDTDTRLTVEVGFLAYLLKGGMLAALLNVTLLLYASYLAVYKSKSRYVKWLGFLLITHVLLLFVENLVSLDLYNLCIWLFVGVCSSKEFQSMNDEQIKELLRFNKLPVHQRPLFNA
jgi:hypothetical protein